MPSLASILSPLAASAMSLPDAAKTANPELVDQIQRIQAEMTRLSTQVGDLANQVGGTAAAGQTRLSIAQGYIWVFLIAFLVSLCATPLMRRLALKNGIVDRPSDPRKIHRMPVAYLGGMAVFLGLLGGIFFSYVGIGIPGLVDWHTTSHQIDGEMVMPVPPSILLGITVIMLVGLLDDVMGISPRVKVGGQLIAAAALALDNVGTRLAAGIIIPLAQQFGVPTTKIGGAVTIGFEIPIPGILGIHSIPIDMVYWIGTAIIAIGVLGMCNATNLLDGLDGLLSGTTAISAVGLLVLALSMALFDDGPRDAQRIILCMALLGACLGFLPHNFNPATIFLGDTGSLLLGFCACVIILTLGDTGKTHLVAAGAIIFAVPLIDTSLAIVRRKLEGKSISSADSNHLHHMLKRAMGVKGAVLALYAMAACFATLGVGISLFRARMIYVLAVVLAAFIGVTAIKIARRRFIEDQAAKYAVDPAATVAAAGAAVAIPAADGVAADGVHPEPAKVGVAAVAARDGAA